MARAGGDAVADTPARFANALKTANKLVRPLLWSRLHPLLSRRLMLLDYTGARSGRRYTVAAGMTLPPR
jgi:hypothetical protein